jgi:hypothetical protein
MSMILDGSNGVTFNDSSLQGAAASPYGLKNRIINGDMRIDQRNAGASVTPTTTGYTIDRWEAAISASSKFSVQRSTTAPTGFSHSMLCTSLSAYTVGSGELFIMRQHIEANNTVDFAWGTASAKTVTLSFWVRSSLTGTFGGLVQEGAAASRTYPFTYTISAANTWEQKTITITGDTSGTWGTGTGIGVDVTFSLGCGSTLLGTAGSWAGAGYYGATGQTNLVATNGATFYVTGVQLEVGSTATPFERRMYGNELALCQRYYYRATPSSGGIGQAGAAVFVAPNASEAMGNNAYPVTMRAAPTISFYDNAGTANSVHRFGIADTGATVNPVWVSNTAWLCVTKTTGWATGNVIGALWNASAEL